MDDKKLKLIFDAVGSTYDIGKDLDEFKKIMSDSNKRKIFFDAVSEEYDIGKDIKEFESIIGFSQDVAPKTEVKKSAAQEQFIQTTTPQQKAAQQAGLGTVDMGLPNQRNIGPLAPQSYKDEVKTKKIAKAQAGTPNFDAGYYVPEDVKPADIRKQIAERENSKVRDFGGQRGQLPKSADQINKDIEKNKALDAEIKALKDLGKQAVYNAALQDTEEAIANEPEIGSRIQQTGNDFRAAFETIVNPVAQQQLAYQDQAITDTYKDLIEEFDPKLINEFEEENKRLNKKGDNVTESEIKSYNDRFGKILQSDTYNRLNQLYGKRNSTVKFLEDKQAAFAELDPEGFNQYQENLYFQKNADQIAKSNNLFGTVKGSAVRAISRAVDAGATTLGAVGYNTTLAKIARQSRDIGEMFPKSSRAQAGVRDVVEFKKDGKTYKAVYDKDEFSDEKKLVGVSDEDDYTVNDQEILNYAQENTKAEDTKTDVSWYSMASQGVDVLQDIAIDIVATKGIGSALGGGKLAYAVGQGMTAFSRGFGATYNELLKTPGISEEASRLGATVMGAAASLLTKINPVESRIAQEGLEGALSSYAKKNAERLARGLVKPKDVVMEITSSLGRGVVGGISEAAEEGSELFVQNLGVNKYLNDAYGTYLEEKVDPNELLQTALISMLPGTLTGMNYNVTKTGIQNKALDLVSEDTGRFIEFTKGFLESKENEQAFPELQKILQAAEEVEAISPDDRRGALDALLGIVDRKEKLSKTVSQTSQNKIKGEIEALEFKLSESISAGSKAAYDFDGTLYDNAAKQLTPLGKLVKQRIENGEDVKVITARDSNKAQEIQEVLGIKAANVIATGKESAKKEELRKLGISPNDYFDADNRKLAAIRSNTPAAVSGSTKTKDSAPNDSLPSTTRAEEGGERETSPILTDTQLKSRIDEIEIAFKQDADNLSNGGQGTLTVDQKSLLNKELKNLKDEQVQRSTTGKLTPGKVQDGGLGAVTDSVTEPVVGGVEGNREQGSKAVQETVQPRPEQPVQVLEEGDAELEDKKADIERRRQEELEAYNKRDTDSLEAIMPNNPNHKKDGLGISVGDKFNQGQRIIVVNSKPDENYDGRENPYEVITKVIKPQLHDANGKMIQTAQVEVTLFNTKEEAEAAIQAEYKKIKSLQGKKQNKINAEYDAGLKALNQQNEQKQQETKTQQKETEVRRETDKVTTKQEAEKTGGKEIRNFTPKGLQPKEGRVFEKRGEDWYATADRKDGKGLTVGDKVKRKDIIEQLESKAKDLPILKETVLSIKKVETNEEYDTINNQLIKELGAAINKRNKLKEGTKEYKEAQKEVEVADKKLTDFKNNNKDLILEHGTPHDFDKFDLEKIGTGEGHQAFGYGLYFTEDSKISKNYAEKLSVDREGLIYTVRIRNGRTNEWLEWRDALSDSQAESISKVVKSKSKEYQEYLDNVKDDKSHTGAAESLFNEDVVLDERPLQAGAVYADLRDAFGQQEATRIMQEAGIDGVKYETRGGKGGKFNYVVFNPESILIEKKQLIKEESKVKDLQKTEESKAKAEPNKKTKPAPKPTAVNKKEVQDKIQELTKLKEEYNKTTDENRRKEIVERFNELAKGVQFSIVGEIGAEALDKAEEATFRMDNLRVARDMEAAGKDAKTIKLATGWERGADKNWRYEIGDGKLREGVNFSEEGLLLEDIFEHPELFKAYPEVKSIKIVVESLPEDIAGAINTKTNTLYLNRKIVEDGARKDILRNTIIHETAHKIQAIEGFAGGGHKERYYQGVLDAINSYRQSYGRINFRESTPEDVKRAVTEGIKNEENRSLIENAIDRDTKDMYDLTAQLISLNIYINFAGEVEARNIEKRVNLSPEQRRKILLEETEDVAREDQIVLIDGLGSVQFSQESAAPNFDGLINALSKLIEDTTQPDTKKVDPPKELAKTKKGIINQLKKVFFDTIEVKGGAKKKLTEEDAKKLADATFTMWENVVKNLTGAGKVEEALAFIRSKVNLIGFVPDYESALALSNSGVVQMEEDLDMIKASKESEDIILEYNEQGQHLAPNGKPSNLTEQQAKIVRTAAFKNWFGNVYGNFEKVNNNFDYIVKNLNIKVECP